MLPFIYLVLFICGPSSYYTEKQDQLDDKGNISILTEGWNTCYTLLNTSPNTSLNLCAPAGLWFPLHPVRPVWCCAQVCTSHHPGGDAGPGAAQTQAQGAGQCHTLLTHNTNLQLFFCQMSYFKQ